jgi:thymidylate synthase
MVNMVPEELIGNFGDTHLYNNHIEPIKEQLDRKPFKLPKLVFNKTDDFFEELGNNLDLITHLEPNDFKVDGYESHPKINLPLSN